MRIFTALLFVVALLVSVPATAQTSPFLQITGPFTPGSLVSVNLGQAQPEAYGAILFGFAEGQFPLGHLTTLSIIPAGFFACGLVSSQGILVSGILLPPTMPAELNGVFIHFQGAVIRPDAMPNGVPFTIDLTPTKTIMLEVFNTDPTGVTTG